MDWLMNLMTVGLTQPYAGSFRTNLPAPLDKSYSPVSSAPPYEFLYTKAFPGLDFHPANPEIKLTLGTSLTQDVGSKETGTGPCRPELPFSPSAVMVCDVQPATVRRVHETLVRRKDSEIIGHGVPDGCR
jgi:hypothetical protein